MVQEFFQLGESHLLLFDRFFKGNQHNLNGNEVNESIYNIQLNSSQLNQQKAEYLICFLINHISLVH